MSSSSGDFSIPASTGTSTADSSAASSAPSSAESSAPPSPKLSQTESTSSLPSSLIYSSTSGSSSSSGPSESSVSISSSSSGQSSSLPLQSGNKTHPGISVNRKPSLIHRFKKTFWQGERTINSDDPKFDVAVNNFKSLNDTFYRIRLHLNQYVGNLRGLITTSNAIADDFALGIDEQQIKQMSEEKRKQQTEQQPSDQPTQQSQQTVQSESQSFIPNASEYSSILSAVRSSHPPTNLDRCEQLCLLLERESIGPVDRGLSDMIPMNHDIDKRQQLRSEHDYYFKKLTTLQQERVTKHDGTSQDRQVDKKKEAKLERNQQKYEEVSQQYHLFSSNLTQSLCSFYDHRVSVLGPSLQTFLKVEKEISEMFYQNKISEQSMKEMEEKTAKKKEEMKQEEKKVNQMIRKQTFAEHYFGSQEFFNELQQVIQVRTNRRTTLESLQLIDQQLQKSTQKLVQEAAKESPNLTTSVLTQRETKSEEKEKGREVEVSQQQKVTEEGLKQPSMMKEESQTQTQVQTQPTSKPTMAADSLSKDVQRETKVTSSGSEKEKTEFAGESRSPLGGEPILDRSVPPFRTGVSDKMDRESETTPSRSPSVSEPMFHEKDDFDPMEAAGSNTGNRSGSGQKDESRRSQQTV